MLKLSQLRTFTRSFRKIVLTNDIENIGFKGEIAFVKPGYAMNVLVPQKRALFYTDPRAADFLQTVAVSEPTFLSLRPKNLK